MGKEKGNGMGMGMGIGMEMGIGIGMGIGMGMGKGGHRMFPHKVPNSNFLLHYTLNLYLPGVRLVGNQAQPYSGVVEIYFEERRWYRLQPDGMNNALAGVLCRELGYPGVEEIWTVNATGVKLRQVSIDCGRGLLDSLTECHKSVVSRGSRSNTDLGITCLLGK